MIKDSRYACGESWYCTLFEGKVGDEKQLSSKSKALLEKHFQAGNVHEKYHISREQGRFRIEYISKLRRLHPYVKSPDYAVREEFQEPMEMRFRVNPCITLDNGVYKLRSKIWAIHGFKCKNPEGVDSNSLMEFYNLSRQRSKTLIEDLTGLFGKDDYLNYPFEKPVYEIWTKFAGKDHLITNLSEILDRATSEVQLNELYDSIKKLPQYADITNMIMFDWKETKENQKKKWFGTRRRTIFTKTNALWAALTGATHAELVGVTNKSDYNLTSGIRKCIVGGFIENL